MFKLLTLAIGFYFLYRLFNKSSGDLEAGPQNPSLEDDGEYVDYEEVD